MKGQLSLFEPVCEPNLSSHTDNVSERKRAAIQRYLDRAETKPSVCIVEYSPGKKKPKYFRLMYRIGKKVKSVHIPGGNVKSELAIYRAEKLQELIDRDAELEEVLAMVVDFRGGKK